MRRFCDWLERFCWDGNAFILRHCSFCQLSLPGNQSCELHCSGFVSFHVHHHIMPRSEPVSSRALPCHDNNPLYFFCCCLAEETLAPLQFGKSICCQYYPLGNGDSVDGGGRWQAVASAAQQAQFPYLNRGS